jgi:hypothetical protein
MADISKDNQVLQPAGNEFNCLMGGSSKLDEAFQLLQL